MVAPCGTAALISPAAKVGLDVVLAWCMGGAGGKVTRGRPHTLLDPPTGERCLRRGRRSQIGVAACRPIGCPARAARAGGGYLSFLGGGPGPPGARCANGGNRARPSGP